MKLSIITPTYNEDCTRQVCQLLEQLPDNCEIIVGDDGSTDENIRQQNRTIATMPHCRFWESPENIGRAAMRNRLVNMSEGEWILSLDAGAEITSGDFIEQYIRATETRHEDVFIGGVIFPEDGEPQHSLRCRYERSYRRNRDAGKVSVTLKTGNCLIRKELLTKFPFDENIRKYGHEDMLLGMRFKKAGYTMCYFPSSVIISKYDRNSDYLAKMHEANLVLYEHRKELARESKLLQTVSKMDRLHLTPLIHLWHRLTRSLIEKQLCGKNPSIFLFQLWKLGDYCTLK